MGWTATTRIRAIRPLLSAMRRMIQASNRHPITPYMLRLILATDTSPPPLAIWTWASENLRFQPEFPQVVASLPELINVPVGDCNDFAVAVAALGIAGRIPARFALGYDRTGEPVHIWTQLYHEGQWVDVDPSPGAPPPGHGSPVDVPGVTVVGWDVIPIGG